jgi:hypothetical protein
VAKSRRSSPFFLLKSDYVIAMTVCFTVACIVATPEY